MRRIIVLFMAFAALTGLAVQPAEARSPWLRVTIEDSFQGAPGEGEFVASGRAVDDGAVCPSGTTTVTSASRTDLSERWAVLRIEKVATCDDATGSFDVNLRVLLNLDESWTKGVWNTTTGTGDYQDLRGGGIIMGDPEGGPGGTFLDTYSGFVRS